MLQRPNFWASKNNLISFILLPAAFIYGQIVRQHLKRKPVLSAIKIICVGNFIVGGAGKTPTALYIAKQLKKLGGTPFILTRGFGGTIKNPTQVRTQHHTAREVGDEALMMAHHFPTIVGADRAAAAALAARCGADCAVMDDGFQNPHLHKDFSLLVIDSYGLGNGRLLPAGPLREKPAAALARASCLVVIGEEAGEPPLPLPLPSSMLRIAAVLAPVEPVRLPDTLIAFAGIGSPEKFWRTLEKAGAVLLERHPFGDHYFYREKDAAFLLSRAEELNAALITTEKDYARLQAATTPLLVKLAEKSYTLPIKLKITEGEDLLFEKIKAVYENKKL